MIPKGNQSADGPRITIVTVSYNAKDVIEKTLISVVGQTYPGLDYVVIDGGSTDGTQAIVEKYTSRIAFFVSEPDGGIFQGMNKGIEHAQGNYLLFMNAGDVFADELVLEDVAAFIREHPEADVVYGDTLHVREYGSYPVRGDAERLTRAMSVSHQATFVRTDLLRAHPFETQYRYAADYEQISSFYLEGRRFLHLDRTVAVIEMQDGTTYRHYLESVNELYDIIEARGEDISRERKSQIRRKKIIRTIRNLIPKKLRNPFFRWLAKHYKVL